jgi:hypothetical protein
MRKSGTVCFLLFILCRFHLQAQDAGSLPFVMAYRDYRDYLYSFENVAPVQLESQPVRSFKSKGSVVGYINSANNLIAWYKGEKIDLGDATNTTFDVTNEFLIYRRDQVLGVFDDGKTTQLSFFINDYKTADRLIAFRESTAEVLKVYYEGKVQELEVTVLGSVGSYKVGKNSVAYLNSSGYFKMFVGGEIFEIDNIAPLQYDAGKNIVAYIDGTREALNAFYDQKIITLEQIRPLSFQVGDDVMAYVSDEGGFKIFSQGKLFKIESYAPEFYKVADDAVVFFADNKFQVMKYGTRYELDQGMPLSYQISRGCIAWQDQAHRLHLFLNGKSQLVTTETFVSYELNGDLLRFQTEDGLSRIFYNGKIY